MFLHFILTLFDFNIDRYKYLIFYVLQLCENIKKKTRKLGIDILRLYFQTNT